MIYNSAQDWRDAAHKRVLLFGMSGLGKTHLSNMLKASGDWFHYSVDYRIATQYLGKHLDGRATIDDLSPVAAFLGRPGDPAKGGLPMAEYARRQDLFRAGEMDALAETPDFIQQSSRFANFVCDTGGSICEWIDPDLGANDPLIKLLARETLLIWLKGDEAHTAELVRRFDTAPKPMAYQPEFLSRVWQEYLNDNSVQQGDVNPDDFIRFTYARALNHRQPLYTAMAKHGITLTADDVAQVQSANDFNTLIMRSLETA